MSGIGAGYPFNRLIDTHLTYGLALISPLEGAYRG
jgi:hypothetical protein